VPDYGSPSIRRRQLSAELRRLRERAGLNGDEAAERLGWSASKISRIELHRTEVKATDLRRLLDLYGVGDSRRQELLALARESSRSGWLEAVTAAFPPEYAAYLYAEAEAREVWNWEPQVVPGLLQTADYARAVMHGWQSMFSLPPGNTDRRVEARVVRQQVLNRDPPLELSAVLDESVLHRRFGDSRVMRQQLEKLIEISQMPNIRLQVFPLSSDDPIAAGPFSVMKFSQVFEIKLHDLVVIEQLTGNYYLEDEDETYKYHVAFQRLMANALDATKSRDFITRAIRDN
jgi:transcriptional regulator with XRE-family HTH domain